MKKYIPVFGPQELFDGAPDDAEMAYETANHVRGYYKKCNSLKFFSNSKWVRVLNEKAMIIHAMRRIIKEPKRWTWEDKKAGRLPEVGSLIMEVESQYGFEFVGVCAGSKRFAVKDVLDGLIYFYNKDVISPIETPAEKAQREEDEWVNKAWSETAVFAGVTQDEHDRLRIHLRHIYRAQLSGELAAPKGGE